MISSRPDPTLQDIVYKIVPDLYESKLTTVNTCNYSNGLCQAVSVGIVTKPPENHLPLKIFKLLLQLIINYTIDVFKRWR